MVTQKSFAQSISVPERKSWTSFQCKINCNINEERVAAAVFLWWRAGSVPAFSSTYRASCHPFGSWKSTSSIDALKKWGKWETGVWKKHWTSLIISASSVPATSPATVQLNCHQSKHLAYAFNSYLFFLGMSLLPCSFDASILNLKLNHKTLQSYKWDDKVVTPSIDPLIIIEIDFLSLYLGCWNSTPREFVVWNMDYSYWAIPNANFDHRTLAVTERRLDSRTVVSIVACLHRNGSWYHWVLWLNQGKIHSRCEQPPSRDF